MGEYFFNMAVSIILMTLKELPQDPVKKAKLKKALLKIKNEIELIYGDDE